MAGSSIAARDAAPWFTDFLNAAYYRRPLAEREVDDLRLAFSVLTTYWYRSDPTHRLHARDLTAFHRAYGAHRFDTARSGRGLLTRAQLLEGRLRCSATGSPAPTPTTHAAVGGSRSRQSPSAMPTIPRCAWPWRGWGS